MTHQDDQDRTVSHVVLREGTSVAHYRIVEKIGAGGMGEVFLADDTKLERKVALKFLPSTLISNAELRSRFVREAKAVAKLNHPNIVTIYEVGEHEAGPFLAMEYVSGRTLRNLQNANEQQFSTIIDLALQLCQGLAEAHRAGVVHRDIKAANVLVDEQNRLRILDFGLASVAGTEELTKTGSTLGTVAYMSPEQVSGRAVDHRSDLFSMGIVLYEMITGRLPFKRDSDGATLQAILQRNPEPLNRYSSDIPDQLQQIVSKLLEKNIELRYQSAEGVIADLKRLLYDSHQTTGSVALEEVQDKSIVVTPFSNLSADSDNEYFSDGLTEEIITDLSGIAELRVISRSSALLLKGTKKDAPTIGRELNVRYILTGSVRKAGNSVRITSQLVDAITNQQVWADKYTGTLEDIFEIQEEVSKAIVSNLQLKLTSAEEKKIAERPIENPKVYELFLRAKQEIHKWNEKGLIRAEQFLKEGLGIAGDNALLFSGLAHVYFQFVNMGLRHEDYYHKAQEFIDKSLAIDPNLSQTHLVRGMLTQASRGEQYKSLMYYRRALELEPNNVEAMGWLALELGLIGRPTLGRELVSKAILHSPLALDLKGIWSWIELLDGRFDECMEIVRDIYQADPESNFNRLRLSYMSSLLGHLDEAKQFVAIFEGEIFQQRCALALYYGKLGEKEKSLSYLNEETELTAGRDSQYSLFLAIVYLANAENERAIDWLEQAAANGFLNHRFLTEHYSAFEPIRETKRFLSLVESMKRRYLEIEMDHL